MANSRDISSGGIGWVDVPPSYSLHARECSDGNSFLSIDICMDIKDTCDHRIHSLTVTKGFRCTRFGCRRWLAVGRVTPAADASVDKKCQITDSQQLSLCNVITKIIKCTNSSELESEASSITC